jgi:23S rRNA (pseudouridine1915-N3)-methyltransferase
MDIGLLAVGRLKAGPERELCARYLERAQKSGTRLGFRGFTVKEVAESRAPRGEDRAAEEADALTRLIGQNGGQNGRVVCLDAGGKPMSSDQLARSLARDAEMAMPLTSFVIGGPDGLGEPVLALADRRLSFGRATWPHQLVRVMLAEQLYRAMTILSGHPYHRA